MGTRWRIAAACAALAAVAGGVGYGLYSGLGGPVAQSALAYGAGSFGLLAGVDPKRGCHPSEGSSAPFPATGLIPMSAGEKTLSQQAAALNMPVGVGAVTVANEDDAAVAVLFVGEDGRPRAKAFVRGSSVATLSLPAGAYDAMYESGTDWRVDGGGFGACARSGKVKGIVVAQPGAASEVVLFGDSMFVLGNRIDPEVAARLEADDKKRRDERSLGHAAGGIERPGREERSERSQAK